MTKEYTLELPYPPSANRYWRNFRGRTVVSAEAKKYKQDVALLARAAGVKLSDKPITLTLDVYRPIKRGDLSNRIKVLEDALQGVAYLDDAQVVEITARRFDDKLNPRVKITISSSTTLS